MIFGIISLAVMCVVVVYLCVNCYLAFFGVAPFVPTPIVAVHEVLKHAKIKKGEILYDLGAGDGRFLHYAEKDYGAHAIGYEVDPGVFLLAKMKQWLFGWKGKMVRANFKSKDVKDADVIVCYMMTHSLKKLQGFFEKRIKGGTRVVSYVFAIGDLKPRKIIPRDKERGIGRILVY
jgi:predicted RNA methylase